MPLSSFMHHCTAVPITVLPLHTALSSCQGAAGEDGLQHEVKHTLRGTHIRQPLCAGVKRLRMCLYCPLTNGGGIHMSQRDRCPVQCLRGDNSWSTEASEQLQNCPATPQCLREPVTLNMKRDQFLLGTK